MHDENFVSHIRLKGSVMVIGQDGEVRRRTTYLENTFKLVTTSLKQTYKGSSAKAEELCECVWPFCGVGA